MKNEITPRQKEILSYIFDFIEENGYSPSMRDIASNFNIASTNGVSGHIDALITKKFLEKANNASRTLTITSKGLEQLGKQADQNKTIALNDGSFSIPILGRVAAGFPILHYENFDGAVVVDPSLMKEKKDTFALKVKGDSMINAGIFEDDIVIVHKQGFAGNGDVVVAQIDGEITVKTYLMKNNQVYLLPANDKYEPIVVGHNSSFVLIGKVTGVTRCLN